MSTRPPWPVMLVALLGGLVLSGVTHVLHLGWLDWFALVLMWTAVMFGVGYRAGRRRAS